MDNKTITELISRIEAPYFTAKQLCGALQTKSTAERKAVGEVLSQLVQDAQLVFDERNNRYRKVAEGEHGKAVFQAHQRGFGFLLMEQGGDLFVPAAKTHGAFHRDTVLFRRVKGTEDEAEVVKVLQRGMPQLVGTYSKSRNVRFVLPDEPRFAADVYIPPKKDMGARSGQKVVVRITSYPQDNRNNPEGEIIQVLGYPDEPDVDMQCVAASYGLTQEFSPKAEARAEAAAQQVQPQERIGRRDLTAQRVFTIDGEDAKDLDDAVSVHMDANGRFVLGVHIADVSNYVLPGGDIDRDAFERGTSVYLPQTVYPMLPRQLSNGICSLFEGVDRLALSCEMTVNSQGAVVDFELFPSVIRSCHRLTYTAVQGILDGDPELCRQYADVAEDLRTMQQLAQILAAKRDKRGNIEFLGREVTFVHNDRGEVVDVVPLQTTFAHRLIEEFMILANETVAQYAEDCGLPFVFRTHALPEDDKLDVLFALMRGLGLNVRRTQQMHSSVLQAALVQAQSTPYFHLINDVMLRTMQKAKYSDVNSGHFGLASRCYCHFTSPIRRYADLTVHRVLKTQLAGKMTAKAMADFAEMCADAARQCNVREKLADEAERRADDVKKCAYAARLVGQEVDARISGVTERGFFAEMPNTVEGFVSVETLGELQFDPNRFCLFNDALRYSLGDPVRVRIASVNRSACKIDFDLVSH